MSTKLPGEFELIRRMLPPARHRADVLLPNGDDAAVVEFGGVPVAISVDTMVEERHFSLAYFSPRQVGIKAIESSFSDIIAVGGRPSHCLIALSLPPHTPFEFCTGFYEGADEACTRLAATIIGGDTTSTGDKIVVSVTVFGTLPSPSSIVSRSGAREGDVIFLSGPLGGSAGGLHVLQNQLEGFELLKTRHLEPRCRFDFPREVLSFVTAMIDISDGLSSELLHICEMSGCSCEVYLDAIPLHPELKNLQAAAGINPLECALNGGEDYELLFTVPPHKADGINAHRIGLIKPGGTPACYISEESRLEITSRGFNHFRT
jgi:thiamine-monophosphate kinase